MPPPPHTLPTTSPATIIVLTREHLGDLICTTPALRALRQRFPEAKITVEVGERAVSILENNPHVDEIVVRPTHQGLPGKFDFVRFLRRRKFDMAVILDDCADFSLYVWLGRVPQRIGLKRKKRFARLLTQSVPFDFAAHEMVDNFRNVVGSLDADISDSTTEVFPTEEDQEAVAKKWDELGIEDGDRVVGFNPGASAPSNRWLPECFAELGDLLLAQPHLKVVLFGGQTDLEFSEKVRHDMKKTPLVLTGKLSVMELAEALGRCAVVVTGDTGPMHLAVAMKTPVVALFGPADPAESGPGYAPGHTVIRKVAGCPNCTKYVCREDRACMKQITASEVAEAVFAYLDSHSHTVPAE